MTIQRSEHVPDIPKRIRQVSHRELLNAENIWRKARVPIPPSPIRPVFRKSSEAKQKTKKTQRGRGWVWVLSWGVGVLVWVFFVFKPPDPPPPPNPPPPPPPPQTGPPPTFFKVRISPTRMHSRGAISMEGKTVGQRAFIWIFPGC